MSVFDTPYRRVLPHLEPSRRMFIATGLAGGFALAVQPASAEDNRKDHRWKSSSARIATS